MEDNKITDAIDTIKANWPPENRTMLIEALTLAIGALEKQMHKKPIMKDWSPAFCPSCGKELSELIGDGYYKHWTNRNICDCGQKLNWG